MTAPGAEVTGLSWMRGTEQPIRGSVTVQIVRWEEKALGYPRVIPADLGLLGMSDREIRSVFELAAAAKAEMDEADPRLHWRSVRNQVLRG